MFKHFELTMELKIILDKMYHTICGCKFKVLGHWLDLLLTNRIYF